MYVCVYGLTEVLTNNNYRKAYPAAGGPIDALVSQTGLAGANSSERWTGRVVASLPSRQVDIGCVRTAQRVDRRGSSDLILRHGSI